MYRLICCMVISMIVPLAVSAQGTTNDLESDFGARISASANKKIIKGLHVSVDGEARLSDNWGNLGRWQAGLGVSYKVSKAFKMGAGYTFIEKKNSSGVWKPRHRFYVDGMVSLRSGDWRFSIKERLQLTHRDVNNTYQSTPNSLALKSRFKVSYKGHASITPYGYVELRNVFNDPACTATWSTTSLAYSDYAFKGYSDAYFNRVRGSVGLEWEVSKQHALDFFVLTDYCYDKEVDTNAEGTKLKSLTYDQAFNVGIGVGYQFSF